MPLLEGQGVLSCLVDSMVRLLQNLCWDEGSLAVLMELDQILHLLEVGVKREVQLNRFSRIYLHASISDAQFFLYLYIR